MNRAAVGIILSILLFGMFSGCFGPPDNKPPVPNLTVSTIFVNAQESVVFSANGSVDTDGEIKRYYWDFDDGTNENGQYVDHQYEDGGNYTVVLIVTDNDGDKAVQTIIIHVNALPKPQITIGTQPAYIHEDVYFYANESSDLDGYITNYTWDFGDGYGKEGMFASHRYTEKKHFNVTLTVEDNDGAKAATHVMFPIIYRTYLVEWESSWFKLGDDKIENLNEYNSSYFTTIINKLNLTKVVFNLTWDDSQPYIGSPPISQPEPNDKFIMNVTSPDNQQYERSGIESEKILITVPSIGFLNPIPDSFYIESESKEILKAQIALDYTTSNGMGDWDINITCEWAEGAFGTPDVDFGEEWTYNVICYFYSPIITKLD